LALGVQVQQRLLIRVTGLANLGGEKLDVEGVRVLEVLDLHSLNDL
jgi:hypothetical protein